MKLVRKKQYTNRTYKNTTKHKTKQIYRCQYYSFQIHEPCTTLRSQINYMDWHNKRSLVAKYPQELCAMYICWQRSFNLPFSVPIRIIITYALGYNFPAWVTPSYTFLHLWKERKLYCMQINLYVNTPKCRAGLCPWDNRGKANSWRPQKKKFDALQYCDSNEFIGLTVGTSRVLMSKVATNNICSNKHKA
jgi:hypothetical protein